MKTSTAASTPSKKLSTRSYSLGTPLSIPQGTPSMNPEHPENGERVENRISCLSNTLELMEKEVLALQTELDPVLQPAEPIDDSTAGTSPLNHSVNCAVVDRLRSINNRIEDFTNTINRIRNRLRL